MLPCSVHVVSPSKVRNGDKWGKNNITELACVCACVCSMCPCNSSKLEALWSPFMQRQQSVTRTCQSLFLSHTHTELCLKQFRFGNEIHKAHYSQCDSSRNISRPFQLLFFCFFFFLLAAWWNVMHCCSQRCAHLSVRNRAWLTNICLHKDEQPLPPTQTRSAEDAIVWYES